VPAAMILLDQVESCEWCHTPLCLHHHPCMRAEGWTLSQSSPGEFIWTTLSPRGSAGQLAGAAQVTAQGAGLVTPLWAVASSAWLAPARPLRR
jgi:hypothetical protein